MRKLLKKSISDPGVKLGNLSHAEKVKARAKWLATLTTELIALVQRTGGANITLRRCINDLQQKAGAVKAAIGVCHKRIELRSQRPPDEIFQDDFSDALDYEHSTLLVLQEDLTTWIQAGKEFVKPLETAKEDLKAARLSLPTDRTGYTEDLIQKALGLLDSAESFGKQGQTLLNELTEKMNQMQDLVVRRMKRQISETYDLRMKIEAEMMETAQLISQAERKLEKTQKTFKAEMAKPERQKDFGGDGENSKLAAKDGVLGTLRQKIKSAAYTGPGARDLVEVFTRFDRDKSGELDEEEIRIALRRSCKIPPSVISDVEIMALCEMLDEDESGSVSIAEMVDFLLADLNVEELEAEIATTDETLERLKTAHVTTLLDFRAKSVVWRINEACSKVTPVKGLELDREPVTSKPPRKSSMKRRPSRSTLEPPVCPEHSRSVLEPHTYGDIDPSRNNAGSSSEPPAPVVTTTSKVRETLSEAVACSQHLEQLGEEEQLSRHLEQLQGASPSGASESYCSTQETTLPPSSSQVATPPASRLVPPVDLGASSSSALNANATLKNPSSATKASQPKVPPSPGTAFADETVAKPARDTSLDSRSDFVEESMRQVAQLRKPKKPARRIHADRRFDFVKMLMKEDELLRERLQHALHNVSDDPKAVDQLTGKLSQVSFLQWHASLSEPPSLTSGDCTSVYYVHEA